MTKKEKLERLTSLESMIDSCFHEIASLMPHIDTNGWYRIRDSIQDEISQLDAEVNFEDEHELVQTGP